MPCVLTTGPNTNRVFNITGDTVLPVVCWESCMACPTTPLPPAKPNAALPISWDDTATVSYVITDFGSASSTLANDPLNANNTVLMTEKTVGAATWAGTTIADLDMPIPFGTGSTTLNVLVFSQASGTFNTLLKVEDKTDGNIKAEVSVPTTYSGGWDTLSFDFSLSTNNALNFANTYDRISIFHDFNVAGNGNVYYTDNVWFVPGTTTPPPPVLHNVTFQVDMRQVTSGYTTPEVNGTFNGWCGNCDAMTDANNDSIWEITLPLNAGQIEYKFAADAWSIQENLTPGMPCVLTTGGFTNRVLNITSDTILPVVCWESCISCGTPPPPGKPQMTLPITWDDTANVDYTVIDFGGDSSMLASDPINASNLVLMSVKKVGAQTWAGTTFGSALGDSIPFTATNTTISAVVYSPAAGLTVKLKAEDKSVGSLSVETDVMTTVANGWDTLVFDFTLHSPNTPALNLATSYEKLSIFYDFGNAGTGSTFYVDHIAFGGIATPPPVQDTVDVTFNVNMALTTPDSSGVYLAGGGIFGDPGDNLMTDPDGDGIYSITVKLPKGTSGHYIFTNGNCPSWSCKENIAGKPCADPSSFNDRILPMIMNDTVLSTCFGECTTDGTCPSAPDSSDVTFVVNMNEHSAAFTSVELNGTFNSWCGNCNPMDDSNNDGIWETTLRLANGTYEYKFTYDNWAGQETFDPASADSACTVTSGGFTNRLIVVAGDVTTIRYCWESCDKCITDFTEEISIENIEITSLINEKKVMISGGDLSSYNVQIFDIVGKVIVPSTALYGNSGSINMSSVSPGIYIVTLRNSDSFITRKVFIK